MRKLLLGLIGLLFAVPGWATDLPSGYTELEYIESTGTQWIDTGFYYTSANHKAVVKFSHVEPGSGAYPYWVWGADGGGGAGSGSRTGALALQSGGTKIGVGVGSAAVGTTTYTIDNPSTPITVSVETKSNNTFTVIKDGVAVYTDVSFAGSGVAETPVTEVLFGVHAGSGVSRMVATKIYFAQFYDNGTLVRDMIPAKNSSGVVGMYDTVGNRFYTNAGSGTFTAGPVVNPCRNLFDKDTVTNNYVISISNGNLSASSGNFASSYIAVTGGKKYTLNRTIQTVTNGLAWFDSNKTYISGKKYDGNNGQTFEAPANAAFVRFSIYSSIDGVQFEQGDTATNYVPFCANAIKIATTAYNSARFSPVVTELNDTIATIRSVVTNTINQTKAIADLQATKQTRPNETCPAGKKCLLVEDNDGQPHWYEIIENAD